MTAFRGSPIWRRLWFSAAAVVLGACSPQYLAQTMLGVGCLDDMEERVAGIDWSRARIVTVGIRQGAFDPMIIRLLQDQSYIFRIVNRDDTYRDFRAEEFFASIAVDRVTIGGYVSVETCSATITVPPQTTAEMRFVAVRDGRYAFEDQPVPLPGVAVWGGSGIITINTKSTIPVARLNYQREFEAKPPPIPPARPPAAPAKPDPPAGSIFEGEEEEGEGTEDSAAPEPATKSIFDEEEEWSGGRERSRGRVRKGGAQNATESQGPDQIPVR